MYVFKNTRRSDTASIQSCERGTMKGRVAGRKWFNQRKYRRSSLNDILFVHSNATPTHDDGTTLSTLSEEPSDFEEDSVLSFSTAVSCKQILTREDIAAIKIQACYRGHLARRALQALRSLVRLQGMARGAFVRRQAHQALNSMHTLLRLQVRLRARQLRSSACAEEDRP